MEIINCKNCKYADIDAMSEPCCDCTLRYLMYESLDPKEGPIIKCSECSEFGRYYFGGKYFCSDHYSLVIHWL